MWKVKPPVAIPWFMHNPTLKRAAPKAARPLTQRFRGCFRFLWSRAIPGNIRVDGALDPRDVFPCTTRRLVPIASQQYVLWEA